MDNLLTPVAMIILEAHTEKSEIVTKLCASEVHLFKGLNWRPGCILASSQPLSQGDVCLTDMHHLHRPFCREPGFFVGLFVGTGQQKDAARFKF